MSKGFDDRNQTQTDTFWFFFGQQCAVSARCNRRILLHLSHDISSQAVLLDMAGDETACKGVEKVSAAILNDRAFPMYTCMA
jgi:hypothetical protein